MTSKTAIDIANAINIIASVGCHCSLTEMCVSHKQLAKTIDQNLPKMVDISEYSHYKIVTSVYRPSGGEQKVFKDRIATTINDCDCHPKSK